MYGTALIYLLEIVWMMCFWQALCVKGSNPWEVPTGKLTPPANISSKLLWEPQCQTHLRYLQDGTKITASIPPRLDGQWVSSRCEVRTGPEFLTRSYIFYPRPMQLFKALQHYYLDSDCQVPAYSLLIQGKLNMRQASWITRGATEAEYTLHKVSLVIHNQQSAYRLTVQVPSACLDLGPEGHLLPHHQYELFNVKAEKDCLGTLHFSMMELQLLRVETHYHAHGQLSKELFLGDVHTDWNQRVHYRPTGYQEPLQNAMHHIHPCPVCALVYHSSEKHPPVLPPSWSFPLDLNGHWVSQRCEARPAVLFLTRLFIFDKERRSWEGTYHHYSDPNCRHRTFSIVASGRYSHMEPSAKVRGATELVFTVTHTKVTVVDLSLVQLLNSSEEGSCGQAGRWEPGTEQDVTWTAGCKVLGILLPHTEYELFKMERDHKGRHLLFIGERPPDGGNPDRPVKRPTSFQTPMVHCSARARAPPRYSPYSGTTSGVSSAMVQPTSFVLLSVYLLSLWFWYMQFSS